ncbi:helix-turn-helix domain-containing protein [Streptomyces sp. SBT349]|uniref:helix-turn-helix domain-containing protein n=1 Tax=Streptomyces sp. SBT349 TaxID=1580539 RepID=UPI00066B2893|nr:helix-turn-helix transcriptional regulator [Streptomyces sp. SBT349]
MKFEPSELTPDRSARHFYGADLRRLRTKAKMSLVQLAGEVPCSKSQLGRIETAESMPPPGLSEEFDRVFKTDGHFARLYGLVSKEIHPEQYRRSLELESRSSIIREYAGPLVPGLLQTPRYAEALFRAHNSRASDEEVQEKVDARVLRQRLLQPDSRLDYCAIVDEAALRRPMGGPQVMREQLHTLLDAVSTPSTVVQVMPFAHGPHGLLGTGMLTLMTLDDGKTYAYEEGISTGTLMEDIERVNTRARAYDRLRSHALPPAESATFIKSVMEALPK